jgi:hypothetical protein
MIYCVPWDLARPLIGGQKGIHPRPKSTAFRQFELKSCAKIQRSGTGKSINFVVDNTLLLLYIWSPQKPLGAAIYEA